MIDYLNSKTRNLNDIAGAEKNKESGTKEKRLFANIIKNCQ